MFNIVKNILINIFIFITIILWSIMITAIGKKLGFYNWQQAQIALVIIFFCVWGLWICYINSFFKRSITHFYIFKQDLELWINRHKYLNNKENKR